jgi:hypothetical protein
MANRQGDVDLRFEQVFAPQLTLWLGLAWLGLAWLGFAVKPVSSFKKRGAHSWILQELLTVQVDDEQ